ncbi:MAG: RNase adapter RapZ [Xanthomonadaceae bacterium]|nr:RNase adapter RapZ [Xanthomonadaceae bacterium]MDP2185126.1 RNase adapter RapZ [Xanthomonadales bacterium]MDZ4115536.1 RNase adapter RapZ [Xanthomonadaceae bacterium]MDZ4379028.1 RNase adapter RapZ [Xanthomonadaceae bacterium]
MSETRPRLIVVSGLSGSGKSVALRTLEDLGHYCVDNLPVQLLPALIKGKARPELWAGGLAVSIDIRNADDLAQLPHWLAQVGELGFDYRLVFFEAQSDILVRRYAETRRRHPLSADGSPLSEAIERERVQLAPLRAIANLVIDTSQLNVHQLRRQVIAELGLTAREGLNLMFESFAYRHGIPNDADFVFDTRCLPNPHWDVRLRPLSGRDSEVRSHLAAQPEVMAYRSQVISFIDHWLPAFSRGSTRSYLTIAMGCTGGRHRSVYLAETLAEHYRQHGYPGAASHHRELG